MALLCGCDYCPDGVSGVGKDAVLKLFKKYEEQEILEKVATWRMDKDKYSSLEIKVYDKNICGNCGHNGKAMSHSKKGCFSCGTNQSCDSSLWKEQRLAIKSELDIRKKALVDPKFPSAEIIEEFIKETNEIPTLLRQWNAPNIVSFVRNSGKLLEWPEIYCFQKFLPILTRWQIQCSAEKILIEPDFITKKRILKGVPCFEVVWKYSKNCFRGLISDIEIEKFIEEHPKGLQDLYTTIEPLNLMEIKYPDMVATFLISIEKPLKTKRIRKVIKTVDQFMKKSNAKNQKENNNQIKDPFLDMSEITKEINKPLKNKKNRVIDDFLIKGNINTPKNNYVPSVCSTPKNMEVPSDLENNSDEFDMSDIIKDIVKVKSHPKLWSNKHLNYDEMNNSKDDLDLISISKSDKRRLTLSIISQASPKKKSSDDSVIGTPFLQFNKPVTYVDKFIEKEFLKRNESKKIKISNDHISSFFGNTNFEEPDEFEKSLDYNKYSYTGDNDESNELFYLCDDE